MTILDYIQHSRRAAFVPTTPDEFLALRLACRLGDAEAVRHYVLLASQYGDEELVGAYGSALARGGSGNTLGVLFHEALRRGCMIARYPRLRTLAISLERRHIATAVFLGTHLEDLRLRHIPGTPAKMADAAIGLIRSVVSEHPIETVVMEHAPVLRPETAKASVLDAMAIEIRHAGVPLTRYSRGEVTAAFGLPQPSSRTVARQTVGRMWPDAAVATKRQSTRLDALALGLYDQVERLFKTAEQ